jgi:cobalt/nickel transport system ATP-binding protein
MSPVFELKDVHYAYLGKFPALRGVDLKIDKGEKIAFLGANGTGKSTLLQILDGLIFPDKGTVLAFGRELTEDAFGDPAFNRMFRKSVGFVFQNPEIQLFCPTVREDILFGPLQLGMDEKEACARLDEVTSFLEIRHLLDRSPHQLSIGEKHRVAIASTLAVDPEVLILDEPTAGLDPATTRHIIDRVNLAHEAGKTVITSTHDLHIVEEIADVIHVFSREKRIVRSGAAAKVLADNGFLGEHNLVHMHSHTHKGLTHAHPHRHLEHHHNGD